jgi:hypothetical protein
VRDIITLYDFWTDDTIDYEKKGFPTNEEDKNKFKIIKYPEPHPLSSTNKKIDRKRYISHITLSLPESIAYYMLYRKMLVRNYDELLVKRDEYDDMIQQIRNSIISHENDGNVKNAPNRSDEIKRNQQIYDAFTKMINSSKDDTLNQYYTYYIKKWKQAYHLVDLKKSDPKNRDRLQNGKILFAYVSMLQMHHDIEYFLENYRRIMPSYNPDDIERTTDKSIMIESKPEMPRALVYLVKITEKLKNNRDSAVQIISDKVKGKMIWSEDTGDSSSRQLLRDFKTAASGVDGSKSDGESVSNNSTPQSLLEKYKMAPIDSSIYIKNAMVSAAAGVMVAALFT